MSGDMSSILAYSMAQKPPHNGLPARRQGPNRIAAMRASVAAIALASAGILGATPGVAQASCKTGSAGFLFAGEEQCYQVPAGVSSLEVVAVGGAGGAGQAESARGGEGSDGAQASATIAVTPGETLYVEVGGRGAGSPSSGPAGSGGWNGGAAGGQYSFLPYWGGGGGGGASDVRRTSCAGSCPGSGATLGSRLVVAAGGGGGGSAFQTNAGGEAGGSGLGNVAGGTAGHAGEGGGNDGGGGAGGTLSGGGIGGTAGALDCITASSGSPGTSGSGSPGGEGVAGGGGGGGGYYGGGGGGGGSCAGGGGGGGGSSFGPAGTTFAQAVTNIASVSVTPIIAPSAQPSTTNLSFATQPESSVSDPQVLTITNKAEATRPLEVSGLVFGGADPGDFLIGSSSCGGAIAPGQSCQATVRFVPQATGPRSAQLEVLSNDPASPTIIEVSGTGAPGDESGPVGPAGAAGAAGREGPTGKGMTGKEGPVGREGSAGKAQLVTCLTVTKKVSAGAGVRYQHTRKCTAVPVTGAVSISGNGIAARVTLERGGTIYATGTGVVEGGRTRLLLLDRRTLDPGLYNLVLRRREGGRWVTRRSTLTIRTP